MEILKRVEKTFLELGMLERRVDVESFFTNRFAREL
jgi:hypothetical protein